jgi:cell division transport system permease protein
MAGLKSSRGNWTAAFSTIIGIMLVLTMLGVLAVLLLTGDAMIRDWKEGKVVDVFLKEEVREADMRYMHMQLESMPAIAQVRYLSGDETSREFEKELGEDFVDFLGTPPIQSNFIVQLHHNYMVPDTLEALATKIGGWDYVDSVNYPKKEIEDIEGRIKNWSITLLIISGLFMLIAIALINNTIRLAIFSKRFIIKSMQLVGATRGFITRPFVLKGIWYGLFAAILASATIVGGLYFFRAELPELIEVLMTEYRYIMLLAFVFGMGVLISWISTSLAVSRFIKLKPENLY